MLESLLRIGNAIKGIFMKYNYLEHLNPDEAQTLNKIEQELENHKKWLKSELKMFEDFENLYFDTDMLDELDEVTMLVLRIVVFRRLISSLADVGFNDASSAFKKKIKPLSRVISADKFDYVVKCSEQLIESYLT